jgi:hypothetical protein
MKVLPKLEKLAMQGCAKVTDDAVAALSAFPSLREVDLKGTSVSEKGVAMLREAKPQTRIYSGPWKAPTASFRNN